MIILENVLHLYTEHKEEGLNLPELDAKWFLRYRFLILVPNIIQPIEDHNLYLYNLLTCKVHFS